MYMCRRRMRWATMNRERGARARARSFGEKGDIFGWEQVTSRERWPHGDMQGYRLRSKNYESGYEEVFDSAFLMEVGSMYNIL